MRVWTVKGSKKSMQVEDAFQSNSTTWVTFMHYLKYDKCSTTSNLEFIELYTRFLLIIALSFTIMNTISNLKLISKQ